MVQGSDIIQFELHNERKNKNQSCQQAGWAMFTYYGPSRVFLFAIIPRYPRFICERHTKVQVIYGTGGSYIVHLIVNDTVFTVNGPKLDRIFFHCHRPGRHTCLLPEWCRPALPKWVPPASHGDQSVLSIFLFQLFHAIMALYVKSLLSFRM